jgi:hypothetical protein
MNISKTGPVSRVARYSLLRKLREIYGWPLEDVNEDCFDRVLNAELRVGEAPVAFRLSATMSRPGVFVITPMDEFWDQCLLHDRTLQ